MASSVETIYKSFIKCINEERWQDIANHVTTPVHVNGKDESPEAAFVNRINALGNLHLTVDAITVDVPSQRLGAMAVVRQQTRPENPADTKEIMFVVQNLIWVADGMIYKVDTKASSERLFITDKSAPPPTPAILDLIDGHGSQGKKLSRSEMEEMYRAYIACINARTSLAAFCHEYVTHNGLVLSLEEYGDLIQEAFDAIPDIVFGIDVVIADEAVQRIAVRLEFTGTPTERFGDAEPTGKNVCFHEYVTYSLQDGKIDRVWSIVDWPLYRRQLTEE